MGDGYHVERVHATRQSILQYMLDPTHEVEAMDERWLRRNYYFVDGRSWPQFGIEVALGTLSNVLEGIPLTSSVVGLCSARPACMLAMCLVLLGLLLWRVPNAVRLSQVIGVAVTALTCLCSAAVLANVVSPSDGAEGAVTYIGLAVSVVNGVLGMVEVVGALLPLVPSLTLRARTLEAVCDERRRRAETAQAMLVVPLTFTAPPPPLSIPAPTAAPQPPPPTSIKKRRDDDIWMRNIIAQVHNSSSVNNQ